MKKSILMCFTAIFIFYGCGTFKKITNTENKEKTSRKSTKIKNDSIKETTQTLPTENSLNYNLDDLQKSGDFEQKVSSGDGTESIIKKKGKNLSVRTKTSGSKKEKTIVNKNKEVEIYNAEFIIKESKKIIKRIPFRYWVYFGIFMVIAYRKFLSQLIVSIFPGLGSARLFSIFLGNNKT